MTPKEKAEKYASQKATSRRVRPYAIEKDRLAKAYLAGYKESATVSKMEIVEILTSLKELVEITSRECIHAPFDEFYEELDGKIEKAKEIIKKYEL